MSIDDQELRAIHFLALRVRKVTAGAGPWDADGLMSNLRKIADRNLHMTIEHVLRHAADPNAKTPGVLAGSYTPVAPTPTRRTSPPKRAEECRTHIGQYADNCGGCNADRLAEPADQGAPMSQADALKAARDALGARAV